MFLVSNSVGDLLFLCVSNSVGDPNHSCTYYLIGAMFPRWTSDLPRRTSDQPKTARQDGESSPRFCCRHPRPFIVFSWSFWHVWEAEVVTNPRLRRTNCMGQSHYFADISCSAVFSRENTRANTKKCSRVVACACGWDLLFDPGRGVSKSSNVPHSEERQHYVSPKKHGEFEFGNARDWNA